MGESARGAAGRLALALKKGSALGWYKNEHDEKPAALSASLSPQEIGGLAGELTRRKDGQLVLGRRLDQPDVLRLTPQGFQRAALTTFTELSPLYRLS